MITLSYLAFAGFAVSMFLLGMNVAFLTQTFHNLVAIRRNSDQIRRNSETARRALEAQLDARPSAGPDAAPRPPERLH